MSESEQDNDLGMDLPDDGDESGAANQPSNKKAAKVKGPKKPLSKPVKIGLLAAGGLVGSVVLLSVVGSFMSPSGPTPQEARQAEMRRQAQISMANEQADEVDDFMGDTASNKPPKDDFGLPKPTANGQTRLDTVDRDASKHITVRSQENLRDEYYKDGFNEVPTFEPPVNTVYIEKEQTSQKAPQFTHSESQCLRLIERSGATLEIPEHDYCLSMVERRVARQAALRSLKYMEKPIEHWIDLKRPNIEVDVPSPVVQSVGMQQEQADSKKETPKAAPVINYDSLYYLVDIIGDTAVLRGGNTGRMFEFKEGSKLAYDGVLEKIEGDTVHLRFGKRSIPLAIWNQNNFAP